MKRICVFCGSSAGENSAYLDAAQAFGELLAKEGIGLVYGGSRVGMMGRIAQATLDAGGEVVGVTSEAIMKRELAHPGLTELRVMSSLNERKSEMLDLSDAFVALPGGLGTLEGFCEILTWAQLGLHGKPCGMLDVGGFFQPLVRFFDHVTREGFVFDRHRAMVIVESSPEKLLERLRSYEAPTTPKWIERGET